MSALRRLCAIVFLFVAASVSKGQNVTGSTTVDIDPDTDMVTVTCETDVDWASQGYYQPLVSCLLQDGNGNTLQAGQEQDFNGSVSATVVLQIQGVPGTTYVATGQHLALLTVPQDNPDGGGYYLLDEYNFLEVSNEFFDGGTPYLDSFEFYGPGPEQDTQAHAIPIANTTASGTAPQIPTASRIISTTSSQAQSGCPAGSAGWNRSVLKIMTDQNGADITTANQSLTEGVTISVRNDLNLSTQVQTGTATTNSVGQFTDRLAFCSQACPASTGETDATQVIGLPYQGQQHTLTPNSFVYKCTGNTINGS